MESMEGMDDILNKAYYNDEEDNEEFIALLRSIAIKMQEEDNKTAVINIQRTKQFNDALQMVLKGVDTKKTKVGYKLNSPFKTSGFIKLRGITIDVIDPEAFSNALRLATNFEVYPKGDSGVEANLTFYGLTTPIE